MPKVNIYLPDDLAADARAAGLSLSPIAQRAIRAEVDATRAREAASRDIKAVVERLRETIEKEDHMARKDGYNDGVEWARKYATADELRHIVVDWEPGVGGDLEDHTIVPFTASKTGDNFVSVRHEEGSAYWLGFVDGASKVYEQVAPLL